MFLYFISCNGRHWDIKLIMYSYNVRSHLQKKFHDDLECLQMSDILPLTPFWLSHDSMGTLLGTRMYTKSQCLTIQRTKSTCIYRQLRARRALMLFNCVLLRTRRVLLLYKVYGVAFDAVSGSQWNIVETPFWLSSNNIINCHID